MPYALGCALGRPKIDTNDLSGIHIPLWPVNKLHITHHKQLPPLDMKDSMAALDRFCSTLGVCDLDAFIQP